MVTRSNEAVREVTDRKGAEEVLSTTEAQLSNAMKIARLGYSEYDVADNLFTFNDQFYAILRTTAERVGAYRLPPTEYAELFVHPEDRAVVGEETCRCLRWMGWRPRGEFEIRAPESGITRSRSLP